MTLFSIALLLAVAGLAMRRRRRRLCTLAQSEALAHEALMESKRGSQSPECYRDGRSLYANWYHDPATNLQRRARLLIIEAKEEYP